MGLTFDFFYIKYSNSFVIDSDVITTL